MKYVNVKSDMKNIGVRQNMHLFMTVTSSLCTNIFFGSLIDNGADARPCVLEDHDRETRLNLKLALKIPLVDCALWNTSTK